MQCRGSGVLRGGLGVLRDDTDGTTSTKEYCSFNGEVDIDGAPHAWSAVLSYDYSMANASDNLADTVRTIFIYVNS